MQAAQMASLLFTTFRESSTHLIDPDLGVHYAISVVISTGEETIEVVARQRLDDHYGWMWRFLVFFDDAHTADDTAAEDIRHDDGDSGVIVAVGMTLNSIVIDHLNASGGRITSIECGDDYDNMTTIYRREEATAIRNNVRSFIRIFRKRVRAHSARLALMRTRLGEYALEGIINKIMGEVNRSP